jgi:mannose-6-phosphate isomerase-like protein (cupin superfamily)
MPFVHSTEMSYRERLPGWHGRYFHSDNMSFAVYEISADALPLHEHHHPQEEVWNVVVGNLALTMDGVEHVVEPGCAVIVPPNTPHSARAIGACRAIVVDHPRRGDVKARPDA